jgi:DNA-binding IclR family transcriptional regulator
VAQPVQPAESTPARETPVARRERRSISTGSRQRGISLVATPPRSPRRAGAVVVGAPQSATTDSPDSRAQSVPTSAAIHLSTE